jgi:hypothetical protein
MVALPPLTCQDGTERLLGVEACRRRPEFRGRSIRARSTTKSRWWLQRDSNPCFSLERAVSPSVVTRTYEPVATGGCHRAFESQQASLDTATATPEVVHGEWPSQAERWRTAPRSGRKRSPRPTGSRVGNGWPVAPASVVPAKSRARRMDGGAAVTRRPPSQRAPMGTPFAAAAMSAATALGCDT